MTEPFPFIVGRGRSGTTMMRAILDTHPDVAVPPESPFVVRIAGPLAQAFDPEQLRDRLATDGSFRAWRLDPAVVEQEIAPHSAYADAVRALYRRYAADRGKHRWADKTPSSVMHLPLLARLFPEARFVHIIRDGRDVALSNLDNPVFGPRSLEESAIQWRRYVTRGRTDGRHLGADRYREVRYEAVVADPEPEIRRVCTFVGLEFDPAMLRWFERADDVVASMPHHETRRSLHLPPTTELRNWRRDMESGDLARFELIAGGLLDELGYERSGGRATIVQRVQTATRVVRWSTTQLAGRLGRRRGRQLSNE